MDGLYPNLHDRFKSEGLCPICLMEMELAPRYGCANGHMVCHRCKPYYYACPTCHSPLDVEIPRPESTLPYPPATHFMPHPLPPQYLTQDASAPPMDDYYRQTWNPPVPTEDQTLKSCSYTHLGCWVKVPEHLRELHESRCLFRPRLDEGHFPTDPSQSQEDSIECSYRVAGCQVKTSPWRISIHENYCIYKDKFQTVNDISETLDHMTIAGHSDDYGDPEELVECKYRRYGCMVKMPRRRRQIHQQKCNYSQHHQEDDSAVAQPDYNYDPDEQLPCRWADHGCRVNPKRSRKEAHEEKCNYRMEECAFKDYGCSAMLHPSRKHIHERSCEFAN